MSFRILNSATRIYVLLFDGDSCQDCDPYTELKHKVNKKLTERFIPPVLTVSLNVSRAVAGCLLLPPWHPMDVHPATTPAAAVVAHRVSPQILTWRKKRQAPCNFDGNLWRTHGVLASFFRYGNQWDMVTGWWLTYPSEKYESQLGWLFQIYGKIKHVPNHQSGYIMLYLMGIL